MRHPHAEATARLPSEHRAVTALLESRASYVRLSQPRIFVAADFSGLAPL
jgi:hypothetical protein